MSNVQNLSKRIASLTKSIKFDAYSKIVINITDELYYEAGDDSGRTLTLFCPWGTQEMADNLLAQINGFSYQPFTADGALLDPAAELGDGVNVDGIHSGIYRLDTKFNSNCPANISAPSDEEVDYLFPYESKESREIKRQNKKFSSQLAIHADQIAAEVTARENDVAVLTGKLTVEADRITAEVAQRQNDVSSLEGKITVQADRITTEVNDRKSAISDLSGKLTVQADRITAEVAQRQSDVASLEGKITVQADRITTEVNDRVTAISDLSGRLTVEANRITAEVAQRQSDVASLEGKITVQAERITTEVNDRKSAISDLSGKLTVEADKITAEVEQRRSDVASLEGKITVQADRITTEVNDRKNAISDLSGKLTVQADRITAEVAQRESDVGTIRGQLSVQSEQISAKVSKQGNFSSFGWDLTDESWTLTSNGNTVLRADKDGLNVNGTITATSGTIGNFTIHDQYLSYNGKTWEGPQAVGVYLGQDGIQLGANFKVDNLGNLEAWSGTFKGYIYAGSIQYGTETTGTLNGGAITNESILGGKVSASTLTAYNMNSGITSSLGRADYSYNVCTGVTTAKKIITKELSATSTVGVESLYIGGYSVTKKSATLMGSDGRSVTISYWG